MTRKEVAQEKFGSSLPIQDFKELLANNIFFYTMMAMVAIYFSSCALQFWCTTYIITVVKVKPSTGHLLFGLTAITAPLLGAMIGGSITDAYVSQYHFLTVSNIFYRVGTKESFKSLRLDSAACLHRLLPFLRFYSGLSMTQFSSFYACGVFSSLDQHWYQQLLALLSAVSPKINRMLLPPLDK